MRQIWIITSIVIMALLIAACSPAEEPTATQRPAPSVTPSPTVAPHPTEQAAQEQDDAAQVVSLEEGESGSEATPTPRSEGLALGESRRIAFATDTAMQPTPRAPVDFEENPVPITFSEFYDGFSLRTGLVLSDKLVALDGQEVIMEGYMAPPLKPALDWFVLTRVKLSLCPFCSTDADWPTDIALVYMPDGETIISTTDPVRVHGQMEVGSSVDAETGMVSVVRIYVEDIEILQ